MNNIHSQTLPCGHCGNISRMEEIGTVRDDLTYKVENGRYSIDAYNDYHILKCYACSKINITRFFWHEINEEDGETEILYPLNNSAPVGLPEAILTAFNATERVKGIDVNAYAILMRRLLEMVCLERGAKPGRLHDMLTELAENKEIPHKLVGVAKGLKDFGNIGAHAGSGELTEDEIPILSALAIAILEYVYSAPYLATVAENKLNSIKKGQ